MPVNISGYGEIYPSGRVCKGSKNQYSEVQVYCCDAMCDGRNVVGYYRDKGVISRKRCSGSSIGDGGVVALREFEVLERAR